MFSEIVDSLATFFNLVSVSFTGNSIGGNHPLAEGRFMRAESVDSSGIQSGVNRLGLGASSSSAAGAEQQPQRASYRHHPHNHHHHPHNQSGRGVGGSAGMSSTSGANLPQHHMTLPPGMDAGAMTGHSGIWTL